MAFKGQKVMLSRTLVPPEIFDKLHGVLKDNGAEVCLCCNPEFNSSTDFHVLPSWDSEKFAELARRGCNIVGPECILRCAKERRRFPSSPYTCCLTFDGIRILSTGFEEAAKTRVHQMVVAMGGEFCTKASMDVDFVIAKDVLTPKYKWAAFTLRKPILNVQWLWHCFREHRRVPLEPYRLPMFSGIIMCTTGILLERRNNIAKLVKENGGTLRADLTRECTHLIANSAEGDKFKMVKLHWCNVKCVTEDWFWNSLSEKVCLDESSYPVQGTGISHVPKVNPVTSGPPPFQDKHIQDPIFPALGPTAEVCSSVSERSSVTEGDNQGRQGGQLTTSGEGDQMHLSGCRFFLAGFESDEMRRLLRMVLSGGGTRYMEFNDRVTHVVVGKPSDSELKAIRQHAMWGTVHTVMPTWLEECTRHRREVAVSAQFIVPEALLSHDSRWKAGRNKTVLVDEKKSSIDSVVARELPRKLCDASEARPDTGPDFTTSQDKDASQQPLNTLVSNPASHPRQGCEDTGCEPSKTTSSLHLNPEGKEGVFQGRVFAFAPSFEACMRAEVVQWVLEGGGVIRGRVGNSILDGILNAEFVISPHGLPRDPRLKSNLKIVTTQWIKYCLEEGTLLDITSHILFQPLCCEVPLPGFQTLRFAATQYADRERILLYNLCNVLGAKYQEKQMNRRATHLLCKVCDGEKYEAASLWGVEIVTAEWLYACVAQSMVVAADPYRPKKLTAAEKEAGFVIPTQNPLQLTSHDTGFPVIERCLAESKAEVPLSAKETEIGRIEKKGNIKKKSSLRGRLHALQCNRPLTDLTSQNGGNLDPWDELTASWENDDATRAPTTRSKTKSVTSLRGLSVPVDLGLAKKQREFRNAVKEGDRPTHGSQGTEHHRHVQISLELENSADLVPVDLGLSTTEREFHNAVKEGDRPSDGSELTGHHRHVQNSSDLENSADPIGSENEQDESDKDVAAAIEGLLAQTSKVQSEDTSRSPERHRDLLSHDIIKLGRRNVGEMLQRANFKRPKHVTNRSVDSGGEQPVQSSPPPEDNHENFEESQMDSQVVAYDEDHSEKQKIIERVRTRSMGTRTGFAANVQRKDMSWKAVELNRLLKAADANK